MKQQLLMIGFRERALKSVDTQKQSELLNVYTMANAFREELVESKPYRSIFLTEKGKLLADYCKKRHDIVFNFLIKIGVDIEVAQNDAEGLEHHVSKETLKVFENFIKENK